MRLADLRPYNAAGAHASRLALAANLAGLLAAAALMASRAGTGWAGMALAVAASLAILSSGACAAWLLAAARGLELRAEQDGEAASSRPGQGLDRPKRWHRRAVARAGWQQATAGGSVACVALALAMLACRTAPVWTRSASQAAVGAGALLAGAFVLLVYERHLAQTPASDQPEAPSLAYLARVPLAVAMICGLGCVLLYLGVSAGAYAGRISGVLCLAVSGEMVVRASMTLFVPFPLLPDARLVTTSTVARALVLRRPPTVTSAMQTLFGIDLGRSWALAFMRAALVPVLVVLVLFGWGLSGVEALGVDQRAIYERFGKPVAVFGPGLHVRLPWPAGWLRPVELGVLHDVPIVFDASEQGAVPVAPASSGLPDAEADPGDAADRLWDETHPSEGAYIVASLSRGQQSFESVDIDLRVVYRVGLSDAAALQAAFAVSDPQRLVQARTSRLLARYFAHHTLPGMLGTDRAGFAGEIRTELQAGMDAARSGLDIVAVVVEAIHPPPGAASAYHAVQAAQIGAHTEIAEQQGQAAKAEVDAKRDATTLLNAAAAKAHETLVDAQVRAIGFGADRTADARDHASFVLERRLDKLAAGLAHRQLLIVDHRLQGPGGPTLDMRPPGQGGIFLPPPTSEPP